MTANRQHTVYRVTHIPTGKVYHGITVDINERWKQHCDFYRGGTTLSKHIAETGRTEDYMFDAVAICPSKKDAVNFEADCIKAAIETGQSINTYWFGSPGMCPERTLLKSRPVRGPVPIWRDCLDAYLYEVRPVRDALEGVTPRGLRDIIKDPKVGRTTIAVAIRYTKAVPGIKTLRAIERSFGLDLSGVIATIQSAKGSTPDWGVTAYPRNRNP
jgi:predicted GIY-YIG superfamily endonuclease